MKDFMMIFIGANYEELGLSPEQLQGQMGKCVSGPHKMVSDGPFVESKELVGAPFL